MSENDEIFDDFHLPEKENENIDPTINKIVEKELSEVEQFKAEFDEQLQMSEDPKTELEDLVIEYIQGSGDVDEVNRASYINGNNAIAIDGWSFKGDEDLTSIDLFITQYKEPEEGVKISKNEIDSLFGKMVRFFEKAKSGNILKNIQDRNTDLYQIAELIYETKEIDRLRLYIMTNAIAPAGYDKDNSELKDGTSVEYYVWDAKRIMQQDHILSGKSPIIVDFDADYNNPLPCIKMPDVSSKVECYLCIIPGTILSQVYHKYHQQILEMNVRTFLQFKGASNKGIRDTLIGHHPTAAQIRKGDTERAPEPDMFFAYNNGISTTASDVTVVQTENGPVITEIKDWQIVNGGQTTASISAVMGMKDVDKSDISRAYVSMKVSVIKDPNRISEIVPLISRYANTQSAVKKSDFNINEPFLRELEDLSRSEWAKTDTGKPVSKWFFERTRGQYMDQLKRHPTKSAEKEFLAEYPKKQMFDKTMLAKYMMAWYQDPGSVCRGGEQNYGKFYNKLHSAAFHFDANKYYRTIAKAILFKTIDAFYGKDGIQLPGYKSNMVAYTVAALSFLSNKSLDLGRIWNEQFVVSLSVLKDMEKGIDMASVYARLVNGAAHITYKVKETTTGADGKKHNHFVPHILPDEEVQKIKSTALFKIMQFVKNNLEGPLYDHLVKDVDEGMNINEWTKKPRCWEALRVKLNDNVDLKIPIELLSSAGDQDEEITDGQKRKISEASDVSADEWWSINKWAKETYKLTPRETAFLGQMGYRVKRGFDISFKQAKWALDLYEKAKANGWTYEE